MDYIKPAIAAALLTVCSLLTGCGGGQTSIQPGATALGTELTDPGPVATLEDSASGWPVALPVDCVQPWETVNSAGYTTAAHSATENQHDFSGINPQSEFKPGVERYTKSGDVVDLGEASRLASGTVGAGEISYAQYRLLMGGEQPGAVSADVNPRVNSVGSLSEYWLGLGDYDTGSWEWHGPFRDAQVRLSLPGGNHLSALGNLFVCVVACDGAAVDVVAIGANPRQPTDSEAPPQPAGLTATAVTNGLELAWNAVLADDLAGYRVHYSDSWFVDQLAAGAQCVPYLEGNTHHLLLGRCAETYVRISAVDLSGNESELSTLVTAMPLEGSTPALIVTTDQVSGCLGLNATLTATGAESYDWDLDGDGSFDVTGDAGGTAQVDSSQTGIIRPYVRGTSAGGTAVACGAVSLLVSGNARPVANGYADPSSGPAPLTVNFTGTGTDPDGEIALYSWDFDGNGSYDWSDAANANPPDQVYGLPYLRNVKFRVNDEYGAYDVDTVTVQILANQPPVAKLAATQVGGEAPLAIELDASGSYDLDGSIVKYEWDKRSDGVYEDDTGTDPLYYRSWSEPGYWRATVRVTDDQGATDTASLAITARGHAHHLLDSEGNVGMYTSMLKVDGKPAIAYYEADNHSLKFVRALDAYGNAWAEPVVLDDEPVGYRGRYASMAIINGRPAIGYAGDTGAHLKYVQAVDTAGATWKTPVTVSTTNSGIYLRMCNVNNRPAIAYYSTIDELVYYIRADDLNGDNWTGSHLAIGAVNHGIEVVYPMHSIAMVSGNPALAYYDMANDCLKYRRADDSTGASWGTIYTIDDSANVGRHPCLVQANGYPVIAYYDVDNDHLKFARSQDFYGTDWYTPEVLDDRSYTGNHISITIAGNRPVIAYGRLEYTTDWVSRLYYIRANDEWGATWGNPVALVSEGDTGEWNSVAAIANTLAVSYYEKLNNNLRYSLVVE